MGVLGNYSRCRVSPLQTRFPRQTRDRLFCFGKRDCSKKHALAKAMGSLCHAPNPKGAKTPFSTGKAAAMLARGAYSQYVSANGAKSGKSVSPSVRHNGKNVTGEFFQHSSINLETAVGSQKSTQPLGAPDKIQKGLITTKVNSTFGISPCTPIACASFLRPTAVSRFIEEC